MLDSTSISLSLVSDNDLNLMSENQSLSALHCQAVTGVQDAITNAKFDGVIVRGDTSTALAGALAAFHLKLPIVHVEAGPRTWDLENPFPE